jgi:ectoine hydroxylase
MRNWDPGEYRATGFSKLSVALSRHEVNEINAQLDAYLATNRYGVVAEDALSVARAVHGLHLVHPFFRELCERPVILDAVEAILECPVYVHQFKVNLKAARVGESWPWHQDFIFWKELDGIARPDLVNVAIYLSDAGEESGPLEYYPGSHEWGNICQRPQRREPSGPVDGAAPWLSNVGRDLTFQVCPGELARRTAGQAPVTAIRSAGDIDFFHPQLVHGSRQNASLQDRRLLIITYNATGNAPRQADGGQRPEFLCAREFTPVRAYGKRLEAHHTFGD